MLSIIIDYLKNIEKKGKTWLEMVYSWRVQI